MQTQPTLNASADSGTPEASALIPRQLIVRPWVNHSKTTIGYIDGEGKFVALADCSLGPELAASYEPLALVLSGALELIGVLAALLDTYAPKGEEPSAAPYAYTGTDYEIKLRWQAARAAVAKAKGGAA